MDLGAKGVNLIDGSAGVEKGLRKLFNKLKKACVCSCRIRCESSLLETETRTAHRTLSRCIERWLGGVMFKMTLARPFSVPSLNDNRTGFKKRMSNKFLLECLHKL